MNLSSITLALKDGRYSEARMKLGKIGVSVGRDQRAPSVLGRSSHKIRNITFICGLHRSGTTLFHDYLAKHYDVAFIQRAGVPENEGQFLQDVYPMERPFGGPGSFAFYPQMRPLPIRNAEKAAHMSHRLLGTWASFLNDPDHTHLLEKSPPNTTRIGYLRSIFPSARFIVWTRDPRAVTLSTLKWHDQPINTLMQHWNCAYMTAIDCLREKDCILLSYEDFCADPGGQAARVAEFCGIHARETPLDPATRFATITNSNQKYLDAFPEDFRMRARVKAWNLLGYSI